MDHRDHFAAAALTGLLANGDYSVDSTPTLAWRMADAMLRERDKASAEKPIGSVSVTLTDAEREAVERAISTLDGWQKTGGYHSAIDDDSATLRGLLERLGGER